jgi:hypothetical protein
MSGGPLQRIADFEYDARPQFAKADTAFQAHPLVNRLNLA